MPAPAKSVASPDANAAPVIGNDAGSRAQCRCGSSDANAALTKTSASRRDAMTLDAIG
jgi:hypothetical protein